jgi:hypothetical protein
MVVFSIPKSKTDSGKGGSKAVCRIMNYSNELKNIARLLGSNIEKNFG